MEEIEGIVVCTCLSRNGVLTFLLTESLFVVFDSRRFSMTSISSCWLAMGSDMIFSMASSRNKEDGC